MANEVVWVSANQVTLEASGAETVANAFTAADDAALSQVNHSNYPYGDFVLACAFASAVSSGYAVNLYRRNLDVDGENDTPAPSSSYKSLFVGSFLIPTSAQALGYYTLTNVPLSKNCEFYIENGTNQTISSGWTLKVTPKTYGPATA